MRLRMIVLFVCALAPASSIAQTSNQQVNIVPGRRLKERPGRIIGTCDHEKEVLQDLQDKYDEYKKGVEYQAKLIEEIERDPSHPIYSNLDIIKNSYALGRKHVKRRKVRVDEQLIDCKIACGSPCGPESSNDSQISKSPDVCPSLINVVNESTLTLRNLRAQKQTGEIRKAINSTEKAQKQAVNSCQSMCPGFDCEHPNNSNNQ